MAATTGRVRFAWLVPMVLAVLGTAGPPARAANLLKIGLPDEPKTLNVFRASGRWSGRVLALMYQPLLVRDPDTLELIPWLADEMPVYDPEAVTYTVRLREASWSDGSPVTARDVAFTGRVIREFKVPKYYSKWKFVTRIDTPDDRTVVFHLSGPKAVFLSRTLATPIVPAKEWARVVETARKKEKPLGSLMNHRPKTLLSSGPFVLKEWRKGAYLYLVPNDRFFGRGRTIAGRTLGPYIDGILLKFFGTSDAAILALKKGTIDMFWWGVQPGYIEDLENDPDIQLYRCERSALYYMGFNLRKPPFDDVAFRRAVATLVDKQFIIRRILQGMGEEMDTVVPPGNRLWCCPDPPTYGKGLDRADRVRAAYRLLKEAGYSWDVPPVDDRGEPVRGRGIRYPDGRPMQPWTILTPPTDYDPLRAMSGTIIQGWLQDLGIPATARPMAFSALLQQVKTRRDFDAFILAYGSLSLDPDYLRSFFHSDNDKPRGWNMSGYSNPAYDRLAEAAASTIDPEERRRIVWQMQRIVAEDVPYLPLYNPTLVEAVRKGRFEGWVETLGGIGNLWSFCELKPL